MPGSYSTTEQATPFTWKDGKQIYKKTIVGNFTSVPAAGLSWNHNITNLSQVVNIETIYALGWETAWGNDAFLSRAGLVIRIDSTKMYLDASSSSNYSGSINVTVWYTKSS